MRVGISPKEFAEAIGVSESSVKRWVDQGALEATRTAGGHRRITRQAALRFVRSRNGCMAHPEKLGLDAALLTLARELSLEAAAEMGYELLERGDGDQLSGLVMALYLRGHSIAEIGDEMIRPALGRIGSKWLDGPQGIFIEHRATFQVMSALDELRAMIPTSTVAGDGEAVAITAGVAHDPYLLPTALAAAALAEIGWRAVCLGADTPLGVVAIAAAQVEARLIALSITSRPRGTLRRELAAFAAAQHAKGRMVAIGGQSVAALDLATNANLFVGYTLSALVAEPAHRVRTDGSRP